MCNMMYKGREGGGVNLWGLEGACRHMAAGAIGGVKGVGVATGQAARGGPVGMHLPVSFSRLPICKGDMKGELRCLGW